MQLGVWELIPGRVVKNVLCCLSHAITGGGASRRLEWGNMSKNTLIFHLMYLVRYQSVIKSILPDTYKLRESTILNCPVVGRIYHALHKESLNHVKSRISERWKDLPSMAREFWGWAKIFPLVCWEANLVNTQLDAKILWTQLLIVCNIL